MSTKKQAQKTIATELQSLLSLCELERIPLLSAKRIIESYQIMARASATAGTMQGGQLIKSAEILPSTASKLEFCQVAPSRYNIGHCVLIF